MKIRNKRTGVPTEVFKTISDIITKRLESINWEALTQTQKSEFYTKWASEPEIYNALSPYVNDVRLYLKDTIRRRQPDKMQDANDLDSRVRKAVTSRYGIEIIDVVECRKVGTECRVYYRLPQSEFLIAVGGSAGNWRKLLVLLLEWNYEISQHLGLYAPKRSPVLVLFRNAGDKLGLHTEVTTVKAIAQRCDVEIILISRTPRTTNDSDGDLQKRFLFAPGGDNSNE